MKKPNIIFMHSHNTGRYIQPYGHAVPTPNLQKMAERGVLFRNAFAAAPTCSPSRAAFLTGLCSHSAGMLGLGHRGFGQPEYPHHLAARMKVGGYETAHCGIEHIVPNKPGHVGADEYDRTLCPGTNQSETVTGVAEDYIGESHDKPFFLCVGFKETHVPYWDPEPEEHPAEDERYCAPPAPLPDCPETRRDMAGLKSSARRMDDQYGRILKAVEDAGLKDDTVVFAFADHGLQFPLNMCNLTDHGLAVYLVASGGPFADGKVVDPMVSLLDLAPTCLELAGIDDVGPVHGTSLLPLVAGQTEVLHEELFGEINYHAAYEPQRSVRTDRYKYISIFDDREKHVLPNTDDMLSKQYLLDHGWQEQPREQEMLFDLVFDPTERCNIVDRSDMVEVVQDLRGRLAQWMKETDDPLLDGPIPHPPGAWSNDPDAMSWKTDPTAPGAKQKDGG